MSGALAALMLLLQAAAPAAQAELHYESPEGSSCPDASWFRQAVAARLGRDPFIDAAPLLAEVRIARRGVRFEGTVSLKASGAARGSRSFSSADCEELASDMVVAVSIAIDPRSFAGPVAPAPQAKPPAPAATEPPDSAAAEPPAPQVRPTIVVRPAPAPSAPVPAAAPAPSNPLALDGALQLLGTAGLSPSPTAGLGVRAELHGGDLGLAVELEADLPQSMRVQGIDVSSRALAAGVEPCARRGRLESCAEVGGALLFVSGDAGGPVHQASAGLALFGAGLSYSWSLTDSLEVAPFARAQAVVPRTSVVAANHEAWVTSAVLIALGIRLDLRIL